MRLPESILVTVFECEIPIGLIARSLLFKILLRHHVQAGGRRQFCVARCLLSRFLADPIRLPFLWCTPVLCATRVERRNTAHNKSRNCHQHKKTYRLKFRGHSLGLANHTRFLPAIPMSSWHRGPKFSFSPDLGGVKIKVN